MRYKFWRFVHYKLEQAWHWVYYHRLAPLEPPVIYTPPKYFLLEEREPCPADKAMGIEKVQIYGSV